MIDQTWPTEKKISWMTMTVFDLEDNKDQHSVGVTFQDDRLSLTAGNLVFCEGLSLVVSGQAVGDL